MLRFEYENGGRPSKKENVSFPQGWLSFARKAFASLIYFIDQDAETHMHLLYTIFKHSRLAHQVARDALKL